MRIALVGNPNSGKTSIFNILTGGHQTIGNWPGVTVEKKSGTLKQRSDVEIVDLPGIYSLSPYSPEESVARHFLMEEQLDCVINIVDGTNLERNLLLTLQLLELECPMILAVNMVDMMEKKGISIDTERLSYQLGIPVFLISATKKRGLDPLMSSLIKGKAHKPSVTVEYDDKLEAAIAEVRNLSASKQITRSQSIQLLETGTDAEVLLTAPEQQDVINIRLMIESIYHADIDDILVTQRYQRIDQLLSFVVVHRTVRESVTHHIDRIVTNPWLAFPIFIAVMFGVYYLSIQTIGTMASDWINDVLLGEYVPNAVQALMNQWHVVAWVQDLVLNGIVAGVGSVLGFLPQIVMLFLCLNILEDCGYMARIAFVMDRIFRKMGLSGKSFIPILISTGCGVPGIMASRTIENEDDRKRTIMLATFMPCSAKTAIIALISGAFFPHNPWIAPSVYFISLMTIILSGLILKKSKYFQKDTTVFMMELPEYHMPYATNIFRQTWNKCKSYVKKAATIIFMSSVILWVLSHCNWMFQLVDEEHSMLASIGHACAFLFSPLGFGDWKMTVAVLSAFSAKENIINTLGILFHQTVSSDNGVEIWRSLQQHYSALSAFSFMVFNVLCTPCFAAIGALRRELNTLKSTLGTIFFQCLMAYIASFLIYQYGMVLLYHQWTLGTLIAIIVTLMIGYIICKRIPKKEVI